MIFNKFVCFIEDVNVEIKEFKIVLGSEVRWRLIKGSDSEMVFMVFGKFLIIIYVYI